MITITGYKELSYLQFQREFKKAFEERKKPVIEIAAELSVKSPNTIKSAFNSDTQIVSDKILTGLMQCIKFDACILWIHGQRKYFVSK